MIESVSTSAAADSGEPVILQDLYKPDVLPISSDRE